ncbi:MAG: RDD family protein [Luteolibacter sp.]
MEPEKPTTPAIPPPNLSKQPPPPSSPMDALISSRPPVIPPPPPVSGEPPVKVKILDGSEPDEDSAAGGIPPFNTRAVAMLIDIVVVIGINITLTMLLPGFATKLAWLSGIAYMILRDSIPFLGGQSIGKKAMKIKAVTLDDKPLTGNWEAAVVRNLILVIPPLGLIELFILLTREDKPDRGRRLGDEWAKTKVILVPTPPVEENPS